MSEATSSVPTVKAAGAASTDKLSTADVNDTKFTQVGSQSLQTQVGLNEAANKQQILNMEKGAELDRINAEFFAGQDIRRTMATGAENRLATQTAGEETRATQRVAGEEDRATITTTGLETRKALETAGIQDRLLREAAGQQDRLTQADLLSGQERQIGLRGQEERAAIRETGTETRQLRETEGAQQRLGIETTGAQERLSEAVRGRQQRLGIETTGTQQRKTNLQQAMFRRYKENRDFEQAQALYRA